MKEKVYILAMKDTVRNSKIAIPVIDIFEICMLVSWLISVKPEASIRYYGYPVLYATLLIVSSVVLVCMFVMGKNIKKYYKTIMIMQSCYATIFVMWALGITFIGANYRNSFSELLYVTIITLIPVFCYIESAFWIVVQLVSSVFIMVLAYMNIDHFDAFRTNFSVFTIISIIAGRSLYKIRCSGYMRQVELESSLEANRHLAMFDVLTQLPNRRSYEEKIQSIVAAKKKKIVIAMFDLNGLKAANDNLGHEAGDMLIIGAANTLEKTFSEIGSVYRVGGDEFSGIFEASMDDIEKAVIKLEENEKEWSEKNNMKLSIAYGFAGGDNNKISVNELEVMADNRMYENKKQYHSRER